MCIVMSCYKSKFDVEDWTLPSYLVLPKCFSGCKLFNCDDCKRKRQTQFVYIRCLAHSILTWMHACSYCTEEDDILASFRTLQPWEWILERAMVLFLRTEDPWKDIAHVYGEDHMTDLEYEKYCRDLKVEDYTLAEKLTGHSTFFRKIYLRYTRQKRDNFTPKWYEALAGEPLYMQHITIDIFDWLVFTRGWDRWWAGMEHGGIWY